MANHWPAIGHGHCPTLGQPLANHGALANHRLTIGQPLMADVWGVIFAKTCSSMLCHGASNRRHEDSYRCDRDNYQSKAPSTRLKTRTLHHNMASHWPTIGEPLAKHGQPLANHWPTIGTPFANHWPTIAQLSANHCPTIVQSLVVDKNSSAIECQPLLPEVQAWSTMDGRP